jgi:hypothetical protein
MEAGSMNENHKRIVLSTFRHIDKSLTDIQNLMRTVPESEQGLFQDKDNAIKDGKKAILNKEVSILRTIMLEFMKKHRIRQPQPNGTISTIQSILFSLDISVTELEPQYTGNYGDLGEKARDELTRLSNQLHEHLQAIESTLEVN